MRVCIALIFACCLVRNVVAVQALNIHYSNLLYRLTPFRIDSLVFGACAALIARDPRWSAIAKRHVGSVFACGTAAVAITVGIAGNTEPHTRAMSGFGYTALALTFGSVVLYAFFHIGSAGIISRIFRSAVLTRFGRYSYALYVFHAPLLLHFSKPVALLGTYVLALLSWNCVERHFLKLRHRFPYRHARAVAV
jgi:peptidoglycan/LPS O-acetylase OafA/YrhL